MTSELTEAADVTSFERASIQSIDRASQILSLFDQNTLFLSPAIVAERIGLNRTTAHRYLASMHTSGLLSSGYGPGPLLEQLGTFISGRRRVLEIAPEYMRELRDATRTTVVMTIWGRSGAVVAHVEEATMGIIVLTVRVGTVMNSLAAQTRVLLAFQSDPDVSEHYLSALTPKDRQHTLEQIARVRRDRIAWANLEDQGLSAVAAPVFGAHDIQAALALIGTSTSLSTSEGSAEVEMLRNTAERISAALGG